MPDNAPLPALPSARCVLHASMISASTMVFPYMILLSACGGGQVSKSIRPADDFFHDLVGAAINALGAGIDEGPADRVIAHVAIAAMELQAFVDDLALQIGGPVFGHRRRLDVQFPLQRQANTAIDKDAGDLCFGSEFRELELRILERRDRPAEGLTFLAVVDRPTQRRLAGGHRHDRELEPLSRQFLYEIPKTLPLLADQVVGWNPHTIEEQFRRVGRMQADLFEIAAFAKTGAFAFHQKQRD